MCQRPITIIIIISLRFPLSVSGDIMSDILEGIPSDQMFYRKKRSFFSIQNFDTKGNLS